MDLGDGVMLPPKVREAMKLSRPEELRRLSLGRVTNDSNNSINPLFDETFNIDYNRPSKEMPNLIQMKFLSKEREV